MKNIKHVLPRSRFAADTKLTNNAVIAGAAERATPACSAGRRVRSRHRLRARSAVVCSQTMPGPRPSATRASHAFVHFVRIDLRG